MNIAIIEWEAWDGFLLPCILPDALRIKINPFESRQSRIRGSMAQAVGAVIQINLTSWRDLPCRVESLSDWAMSNGCIMLNCGMPNISKAWIHDHLISIGANCAGLTRDDKYYGDVLIKSNLNHGGEIERRFHKEIRSCDELASMVCESMGPYDYKVMPRNHVSPSAWNSRQFVVERYVSNKLDMFFRVYFAGKNLIVTRAHCKGHIKKLANDERDMNYIGCYSDIVHTNEYPLPRDLRSQVGLFLSKTDIDYGCLDVMIDDHENCFIVDVNVTPWAGMTPPSDELCEFLKLGIYERMADLV